MTLAGGLVLALLCALWLLACLAGIDRGVTPRQAGGDHDAPLRRGLVAVAHHIKPRCRRGLDRPSLPGVPSAAPVSPEDP